jgi:pimeloyl-ACP methyl ester carboxylesterase
LLLIHGTPGSRLASSPDEELYGRIGAHVVTFDRPGYGRSSRHSGRTVYSVADDALAVATEFGWDRFSVLGVSGGGPHALGLGARASERIHRLGIAVGATPIEFVDPADLIAINREAQRRIREEGRTSFEEFLAEPAMNLAADPGAALDAVMADAPPVDREMLNQPAVRGVLVASTREAFANGPQGWFDDAWALGTDWGFQLSDVQLPVYMWYGELDRNVPIASVRTMASHLKVAQFELIEGAGHLGWLAEEERLLQTLLGPTKQFPSPRRANSSGSLRKHCPGDGHGTWCGGTREPDG